MLIPLNLYREKGNTFRGITFFPIQPEFLKISVFVNNLVPDSEKKCKMANSSDKYLQVQTIYGCDRCFSSSPVLSIFLQHRCSTAGENELRFDRFRISSCFLTLAWGNTWLVSANFADESGSTKKALLKTIW